MSANSCRHALKKAIDDFFQMRLHIFQCQIRGDEAHAAVDVEPDAAGRDHTAFVHIHGSDTADGKSITAVAIRHAERVARIPGKWRRY